MGDRDFSTPHSFEEEMLRKQIPIYQNPLTVMELK